jgi:hypothetical protein
LLSKRIAEPSLLPTGRLVEVFDEEDVSDNRNVIVYLK